MSNDHESREKDSLEAGMEIAFGARGETTADHQRQSVLHSLGCMMNTVPQVLLSESGEEEEVEPVVRPNLSKEFETDSGCPYRIDGEIAQGGMGKILKGRDSDLGRDLAIKVLLEKHKDKPEVVQRFVEEAQIGGQLQHPGIAPVYMLGQFDDQLPYFTMKLVKGKTLSALLDARKHVRDDRSRFVGIFEQICQTMAYAHSRGVIHRDLKPANIMVGAFGEVQVMDWGLAKVLSTGGVADEKKAHETHLDRSVIETLRSMGSDTPAGYGSQTQMGSVMGTPAYMPPEQALGEIDELDQRADVFGLGAILCEVLTGKPPYVAEDSVKVFRLASRAKLDDCYQRLDQCDADPELIALAKACTSAEPADRPRDAGILTDRIAKHLEAVETRLRESEIERAAQTARAEEERKRRRVSLALAVSVLTLILAVCGGGWRIQTVRTAAAKADAAKNAQVADTANRLANASRELAKQESEKRLIEEKANDQLKRFLYAADIPRAQTALKRGDYAQAKNVLMKHVPQEGEVDLRGFEWHYLYRQCPVETKAKHVEWADNVPEPRKRFGGRFFQYFDAISFDGKRIAAVIDGVDDEKRLTVWSTESGRQIWSVQLDYPAVRWGRHQAVILSEDGSLIGALLEKTDDADCELVVWDVATKERLATITSQQVADVQHVRAFEFRPGTRSLLLGIDIQDEQSQTTFPESRRMSLVLWDIEQSRSIFEFTTRDGFLQSFRFSPDGNLIAVASRSRIENYEPRSEQWHGRVESVQILAAESGELLQELASLPYLFSNWFAFSPDGSRLAMAAANMSTERQKHAVDIGDLLLVWDVATGQKVAVAPSRAGFSSVRFSPSGKYVALVSNDYSYIELFRVQDAHLTACFQNEYGAYVHFSEDENHLQVLNRDGDLVRWEIAHAVDFDPDYLSNSERAVMSGNGQVTVNVYRKLGRPKAEKEARAYLEVINASGKLVAESSIPDPGGGFGGGFDLSLNHDGSILAIVPYVESQRTVTLYEPSDGSPVEALSALGKDERLRKLLFSPADATVAVLVETATEETPSELKQQVRILGEKNEIRQRFDLSGHMTSWAFSPDGDVLAVGMARASAEATESESHITLYDLRKGKLARRLRSSEEAAQLVFNQDRSLLADASDGSEDASIRIWNLKTGDIETTIPQGCRTLIFSPDSKRLITHKSENIAMRPISRISVWDTSSGIRLMQEVIFGHRNSYLRRMRFLPDSDRLIQFGGRGIRPRIWDGTPVDVADDNGDDADAVGKPPSG